MYCQWCDNCVVQLVLSSGLLIQIQINRSTGDVQKMIFDKYLVGKVSDHMSDGEKTWTLLCRFFPTEYIFVLQIIYSIKVHFTEGIDEQRIYLSNKLCNENNDPFYVNPLFPVIITKSHLLCTYNDNQVTLVHFTKPKRHVFEKMSRLDPKLLLFDLTGPNGRRLDKKIQFNKTGDLVRTSF